MIALLVADDSQQVHRAGVIRLAPKYFAIAMLRDPKPPLPVCDNCLIEGSIGLACHALRRQLLLFRRRLSSNTHLDRLRDPRDGSSLTPPLAHPDGILSCQTLPAVTREL